MRGVRIALRQTSCSLELVRVASDSDAFAEVSSLPLSSVLSSLRFYQFPSKFLKLLTPREDFAANGNDDFLEASIPRLRGNRLRIARSQGTSRSGMLPLSRPAEKMISDRMGEGIPGWFCIEESTDECRKI